LGCGENDRRKERQDLKVTHYTENNYGRIISLVLFAEDIFFMNFGIRNITRVSGNTTPRCKTRCPIE